MKIVLREEGSFLCAYSDNKQSKDDRSKLLIGTIALGIANRDQKAKRKFVKLMKKHVGKILGEKLPVEQVPEVEVAVETPNWHPQSPEKKQRPQRQAQA